MAFFEYVERLPKWLRPAAWGAALLASMTLVRVTFFGGLSGRFSLGSIVLVVILAAAGGAIGGLGFGLLRGLQQYGVLGRWLRWTLAIIIYGAVVGLAFAPLDRKAAELVQTVSGWTILCGLALVYGAVMAYMTRPGT